ncbi:MAG: carbonic anhydrase [Arenicella sp.]
MSVSIDFFARNKAWAKKMKQEQPELFEKLAAAQNPDYLWISCSDSRVPVNMMFDLLPGELFVHRNIANQVIESDMNFLSALQYSVDVLQVKNIIVVGHYGCGGVAAAMNPRGSSIVDNWVHGIADLIDDRQIQSRSDLTDTEKFDLACEENVLKQVNNLKKTSVVAQALDRGRELNIYGWIYNISDGLLKELIKA